MSTRFATTTALLVLFSAPAFADCKDELDKLEPADISAETGAATSEAGMTATKHQKEVMSGNQAAVDTEMTGSTGEAGKASRRTKSGINTSVRRSSKQQGDRHEWQTQETVVGTGDRALSGGGDSLAYGLLRATDRAVERTFSSARRCQPSHLHSAIFAVC
jgi:hypothetical protein